MLDPFEDLKRNMEIIGNHLNIGIEVVDYALKIGKCELCDLKGDTYALPRIKKGRGKKVMFIGEAPGREEAKQHISFVGPSGKELDRWIEYMKIDNYYITNIVKHRPTIGDRDRPPDQIEIGKCLPYLWDEVRKEKPSIVITLGLTASREILHIQRMGAAVKDRYHYQAHDGTVYIVLYHPSYALRMKNSPDGEVFFKNRYGYLDEIKKNINGDERNVTSE